MIVGIKKIINAIKISNYIKTIICDIDINHKILNILHYDNVHLNPIKIHMTNVKFILNDIICMDMDILKNLTIKFNNDNTTFTTNYSSVLHKSSMNIQCIKNNHKIGIITVYNSGKISISSKKIEDINHIYDNFMIMIDNKNLNFLLDDEKYW